MNVELSQILSKNYQKKFWFYLHNYINTILIFFYEMVQIKYSNYTITILFDYNSLNYFFYERIYIIQIYIGSNL